jgi:hypothetical protein
MISQSSNSLNIFCDSSEILPIHLCMADLFHLKEIIPEFEKHLAEKEEEKEEEKNALLRYLGHNQGQIMVLTSGLAGKEKVSGFPKDLKIELRQKDTSFTYNLHN